MSVHTIFVPAGMSVEQAWETIKRGEKVIASGLHAAWAPTLKTGCTAGTWVNVDDEGKVIEP